MDVIFLSEDEEIGRLWSDNTNDPWVFFPDRGAKPQNPRWIRVLKPEKIAGAQNWEYSVPLAFFQIVQACEAWIDLAVRKLTEITRDRGGHLVVFYGDISQRRMGLVWAKDPFPLIDRTRVISSPINWCTLPS